METASGESDTRKRKRRDDSDIPTVEKDDDEDEDDDDDDHDVPTVEKDDDEDEDERLRGMGYRFEKRNDRRIFAFSIRNKPSNILENVSIDGADFLVLKDFIGIYSPETVRAISHVNSEHRVTSATISNHYKLDVDKFCGLSELRSLTLEDVLRVKIHSVQDLPPKLEELTLHDCGWVGGIESICHLVHLQALNLSGSKFGRLSSSIGRLQTLQILNVSHCHLETLPEELWDLDHLKELNLSGNPIASLPPRLGRLQRLETLHLATTQLTTLPQAIGGLAASLKNLYLSKTPMALLPCNFGNLQNLEVLDVENTFLQSLLEMEKLTNLIHLNLEQTAVERLPLGSLVNLETLLLKESKIAPFKFALEKLQGLRHLSVSKAHLQNHRGDILDLVRSRPSLVCITNLLRKKGKKETKTITSFFRPKASASDPDQDLLYALACNRARIRIFGKSVPPSGLWPLLLEHAKRAFCWVPSDPPQTPWSDPDLYLPGLQNPHDAIYRLLMDGNERNSGWFRTAS